MTREELLDLRKKKKRRRRMRYLVPIAGVAIAAILAFFVVIPYMEYVKEQREAQARAEAEEYNAKTKIMEDSAQGEHGWNADKGGWWYKNSDDTINVDGWKVIDGQQYYFKSDGYIADGWTMTADGFLRYFDESGIFDPSRMRKLVALTFSGGPTGNTDDIVDLLVKNGARATFFATGALTEAYGDQVSYAFEKGMEIANGTYNGHDMSEYDADGIRTEFRRTDEVLQKITGMRPKLVRVMEGETDEDVLAVSARPVISWDVYSGISATKDIDSITDHILDSVQDGSVIMCSDYYPESVTAMKRVIPALMDQGYQIVTVTELAYAYGFVLSEGQVYYSFYPY